MIKHRIGSTPNTPPAYTTLATASLSSILIVYVAVQSFFYFVLFHICVAIFFISRMFYTCFANADGFFLQFFFRNCFICCSMYFKELPDKCHCQYFCLQPRRCRKLIFKTVVPVLSEFWTRFKFRLVLRDMQITAISKTTFQLYCKLI